MIKDQPIMGRVYSVCFMCFLYFCFGRGGAGGGLERFLLYSKHSGEERGFMVLIPLIINPAVRAFAHGMLVVSIIMQKEVGCFPI